MSSLRCDVFEPENVEMWFLLSISFLVGDFLLDFLLLMGVLEVAEYVDPYVILRLPLFLGVEIS